MTKIQIEEPCGFVKPWGHYVYIHFRKSNGSPFYVGVGQKVRYKHTRRTDWWMNCARKRGVYVEIVQCFDNRDDAYLLEQWLIAKLRHEGENLVNITNGGAGKPRGTKKSRPSLGNKYNEVVVYCSNGMVFNSFEKAAKWCASKGYKTARGSKISCVTDVDGRSVYGHAWSRMENPDIPKFTGRDATINGISTKKIKTVYCSNGMTFKSVTTAAKWCAENGHLDASQAGLSVCLIGRNATAYGHAWSYEGFPEVPEATGVAAKSLSARHCMKPVICVDTGVKFRSVTEAGDWVKLGKGRIAQSNISVALREPHRTAYGYKWRFLSESEDI